MQEINLLAKEGKTSLDLYPKSNSGYDLVITVETDDYIVKHAIDFKSLRIIIEAYQEVIEEAAE